MVMVRMEQQGMEQRSVGGKGYGRLEDNKGGVEGESAALLLWGVQKVRGMYGTNSVYVTGYCYDLVGFLRSTG